MSSSASSRACLGTDDAKVGDWARTYPENSEAVHKLSVEGSREHGCLEGRQRVVHLGGGAPVNANGARKTMPVNPQAMQKGKAGMNLDFGVFARVDDHTVHVCCVTEDAPTQQNIFWAEADFGTVLVRASRGQT